MARRLILRIVFEVLLEEALVEDVDAHRSEVGFRFRRLLLEFFDAARLVRIHDAEARSFFPRHLDDADGRIRFVLLVRFEHPRIIHRVDVVARKNQHILRICEVNEVQVLIDGIRRAAIPISALLACIRRQDEDAAVLRVEIPRAARCEVVVELERTILRQHTDLLDAGIRAIAERKIDDAVFAAERHRRFRDVLRESTETASLAARQDHGQAFCLSHKYNPPGCLASRKAPIPPALPVPKDNQRYNIFRSQKEKKNISFDFSVNFAIHRGSCTPAAPDGLTFC